jgi:hypothetical protein
MKKKIVVRRKMQEGESWWDSVSAFGRQAADAATGGTYKYARAGLDYAAKNTASALGYGKGTTYKRELDQEKEKLAHDDKEHQQASAAGKLVGPAVAYGASSIPAVGAALSTGEKVSKVPYYLGLARKAIGLKEEIANATGAAIPGSGDTGEAFRPSRPIARRGKFLNQETFVVSSSTFNSLREAKKKRVHWKRYLEEDDAYHDLREYAQKKRKGPIIVEDERTGACMYVRYGDMK